METLAERISRLAAESQQVHAANSRALDGVVRGAAFGRAGRRDLDCVALTSADLASAPWLPQSEASLLDIIRSAAGLGPPEIAASLTTTSDVSAGYLMPASIQSRIADHFRPASTAIRAGVRAEVVDAGRVHYPKWTGSPTVVWREEGAEISASDPTVGLANAKARTAGALVKVTREALQDGGSSFENELIRLLAEAFAADVDRVIYRGDGVSEPLGLVNRGFTSTAVSAAIGSWAPVLNAVDSVLTADAPQPTHLVCSPGVAVDLGGRILDGEGRPIARPPILEGLEVLASSRLIDSGGSTSTAILGGFSEATLAVRAGFSIQVLRERFATTGEIGLIGWLRADLVTPRTAPFHVLTSITE